MRFYIDKKVTIQLNQNIFLFQRNSDCVQGVATNSKEDIFVNRR